jgi:hypothetical protein
MKGQIKRLASEPKVVSEYDAIIKEQLSSGVIERVGGLENSELKIYNANLRRPLNKFYFKTMANTIKIFLS